MGAVLLNVRRKLSRGVAFVLGVTLCGVSFGQSPAGPGERLHETVEAWFEEFLVLNPIFATFNGDHRYDDRFTNNIGPEHRRRSLELEQRFLKQAEEFSADELSDADRLTLEVFSRDRRESIAAAVAMAKPGDLVVVAGKGHETTQDIGGERSRFDDRDVATAAIQARAGGGHA